MSGIFITFEGVDGSGKTTQVVKIADYLKSKGKDIITAREPGGVLISEKIRELILDVENMDMSFYTEALLYAAARAQIVNDLILPSLKENKIVICDRFLDSSLVYQGIARNLGVENILKINEFAIQNTMPDITFFIDVSPKIALFRRKMERKTDRIENENEIFHNMVYDGYKTLAKKYSNRIKTIDGNGTENETFVNIKKEIDAYL